MFFMGDETSKNALMIQYKKFNNKMKAVWYDAKRLLLLFAPQSTVGTTHALPQRKVAYFGGTDRHNFTKKRGIFNDNRN